MASRSVPETLQELLTHQAWVRGLARALVGDADLADDATQQTWLAAIERPPSSGANLRGWLGQVLRRRILDLRRGDRRRHVREQRVPPHGASPSAEDLLSRAEARARVARAVLSLEEPYRGTILLRYLQELPADRVAAIQGVPVSTVHTRLARGLGRLRTRLRAELGGGRGGWKAVLLPLAGGDGQARNVASFGRWMMRIAHVRTVLRGAAIFLLAGILGAGAYVLLHVETATPPSVSHEATLPRPAAKALPDTVGLRGASREDRPTTAPPAALARVVEEGGAPDGAITGLVEDEHGTSVPLVTVILFDASGREIVARRHTDNRGHFRFDGLAPGEYRLAVHASGSQPFDRAVNPGRRRLRVVLPGARYRGVGRTGTVQEGRSLPRGVVAGRILGDDAHPLITATVLLATGSNTVGRLFTEGDGAFRFEGLDPEEYVLTVYARGFLPFQLPVLSGRSSLDVHLDPGPSLAGVVVDAESGRPVEGISITALAAEAGAPVVSSTSGPGGTFRLGGLRSERVTLDVGRHAGDREGRAAEYVPARLGPFDVGVDDLRIEVARGLVIAGRIEDANGHPWLAGATIRLLPVSAAGEIGYDGGRSAAASSDGTFRVPGLTPGRYDIQVAPDAPELDGVPGAVARLDGVPAGSTDLVVALGRGLPLDGRLVDESGEAVGGRGWIWVTVAGAAAGGPRSVAARLLAGGRFCTAPLDEGLRYDIVADGFAGYRRAEARGVRPGPEGVTLVLERGVRIEGRVLASSGTAVPAGVPVTAAATGDDAGALGHEPWAYARTRCGADGRFVVPGLRAGVTYRLSVGGGFPGWVASTAGVEATAPATEVILRAEKGVAFTGRLVDASGLGQESVFLQALASGRPAGSTRTGKDGRFVFAGVPVGRITLRATLGGRSVALGEFEVPVGDVRIALPD